MTESATSLADAMPIQPTYEQIIGSVPHSGVREILRHAQIDEQHLQRELDAIEDNEDLTLEAKERTAQELIDRFAPKINDRYRDARQKVETSAESSYRFSLPFPGDKTYAQARATDTSELLAVQAEAEAIAKKIGGKSLQEMTRSRSKVPGDKGIQEVSDSRMDALKEEFDRAMAMGGVEGRIKAMAIERFCESTGYELEQVVEHHRTDKHFRALQDANHFERVAFALPSSAKGKTIRNPFDTKRRDKRRIGTYSSGRTAVVGGTQPLFPKKSRKPAWK